MERYIFIFTHTHTHTYIYIYTFIYIHMSVTIYVSAHVTLHVHHHCSIKQRIKIADFNWFSQPCKIWQLMALVRYAECRMHTAFEGRNHRCEQYSLSQTVVLLAELLSIILHRAMLWPWIFLAAACRLVNWYIHISTEVSRIIVWFLFTFNHRLNPLLRVSR